MYVLVVIMFVAIMAVAEFVAYTIATVLDDMHQMVLSVSDIGRSASASVFTTTMRLDVGFTPCASKRASQFWLFIAISCFFLSRMQR